CAAGGRGAAGKAARTDLASLLRGVFGRGDRATGERTRDDDPQPHPGRPAESPCQAGGPAGSPGRAAAAGTRFERVQRMRPVLKPGLKPAKSGTRMEDVRRTEAALRSAADFEPEQPAPP